MNEAVAFAPGYVQANLMRDGVLSPVELVEIYLKRYEQHNPELHSYIHVDTDRAFKAARTLHKELSRGQARSPLHGLVFAVKDQMRLDGLPVTGGSKVPIDMSEYPVATVVRRLEDAGAILLGTLNTNEFHMGNTRDSPFGTPRNPWNTDHTTGGSSSGSAAAVAAGLCTFSLGADTGGSIRVPAAYCGVVGLKPTWSRVSAAGVIPLCRSLDCVGPLARSVRDVAAVLQIIAGEDALDPESSSLSVPDYTAGFGKSLKGLNLGVPEEMINAPWIDPTARRLAEDAIGELSRLGAKVRMVRLPLATETSYFYPAIVAPEAAAFHRERLLDHYSEFDESSRIMMMTGVLMPDELRDVALQLRLQLGQQVNEALEDVDLLAGVTVGGGAPRLRSPVAFSGSKAEYQDHYTNLMTHGQLTRTFNLTGLPAVTIPCGLNRNGLPIGLQLAGRHFGEPQILAAAEAFQKTTTWHELRPVGFDA